MAAALAFPVSGFRVTGIEKWRTHRRTKLVHKPSATWSQNVGIAKGRGQPGVACPKTAKLPSAPTGSLGRTATKNRGFEMPRLQSRYRTPKSHAKLK